MNLLRKENVWIGLAEIYSLNKKGQQILGGSTKGFVNVVSLAKNRYDFRKRVERELEKMNLGLKFEVDDGLTSIATSLDENSPIKFGTFYVFE